MRLDFFNSKLLSGQIYSAMIVNHDVVLFYFSVLIEPLTNAQNAIVGSKHHFHNWQAFFEYIRPSPKQLNKKRWNNVICTCRYFEPDPKIAALRNLSTYLLHVF
jgi:hypothetical protein